MPHLDGQYIKKETIIFSAIAYLGINTCLRGNQPMSSNQRIEIRDPIYDFIKINEFEREIIDSSPFQRLRRIQQLALTSMAYPGATHTRFEHSLGTMHLAGLMFQAIIDDESSRELLEDRLQYDEEDLKMDGQLVRIAALLHDVGHPPFSHAAEKLMPLNKKTNERFTHENYTAEIIKGPLKQVVETSKFNKFGIDVGQIAELLEGVGERAFWKHILTSQLDADRGDYLLRDSHHIGVKYGIYDYSRLLNTLTLGTDPETELPTLGIKEDGKRVAESFIIARYLMYTQVTFHKTRRAYDYHLCRAMKEILPNGELPSPESPEEIQSFLKYDDFTVLDKIKERKDCCPHCEAIVDRKHCRCVYSKEIRNRRDIRSFEAKKKQLKKKEIRFWEDEAKKSWYELNDPILIFSIELNGEKRAKPLSEYSEIAKNLALFKKMRLYVALEEKERAKNAIRERRRKKRG